MPTKRIWGMEYGWYWWLNHQLINQNQAYMTTGQFFQICSAYVVSIFQPFRCCLVLSSLPQTRSQQVRRVVHPYEPFREYGF